jgi:threonine/homoserine/homoserine lactone efflux protein
MFFLIAQPGNNIISMALDYLLKGVIIGFSLAAPIGPIGILCVRGTVLYGIRRGFVIGLSGALGDVIYALAAAFGVKLIFDLVVSYQQWMRLLGGIMLIGAGVFTFRFQPRTNLSVNKSMGETGVFASTFFLALTNPLTLFGYAAAFSAVGVNKIIADRVSIMLLIGGVFCGSFLWFSLLVWFSHTFKEKITSRGVTIINKAAGLLLVLFGIVAVFYGLRGMVM